MLYEGPLGAVDPFPVDEEAGVDIDLATEEVVIELGGVDTRHDER